VPARVEGRLWGIVSIASRRAPLPVGTEARLAGFTELAATAVANAEARAEVTASRARIVAAADQTRRRIEQDLHDGAQGPLVTLALQLRAAKAAAPPELGAELDRAVAVVTGALDDLREIARGIHPAVLAKGGLRFALKTLARRCPIPVDLQVHAKKRLPEPVEVSAYYVVAEGADQRGQARPRLSVGVEAEIVGDLLRVTVRDDGVGGASLAGGSGLAGLKDRVEALGARIVLHSPPGRVPACARSSPLPPRTTASPPISPGPETARAALPRGDGRAGARRRRPRCRTRAACGARRCS
jgi:signal transduction histidine kinase